MRTAKVFHAVVVVAYLIVTVWAWRTLPNPAATHFGAGGTPDDWNSPAGLTGVMLAVGVLILGVLPAAGLLVSRAPQLLNLPTARQKAYWTAPEHIGELQRRVTASMLVLSAMTGLLLIATQISTVMENRRGPVTAGAENTWIIAGFWCALVVWMILFLRAIRVPAGQPT